MRFGYRAAELVSLAFNPFTLGPFVILHSAYGCAGSFKWYVVVGQCICALGALVVVTAHRYASWKDRLIGLNFAREDRIRPAVLFVLACAMGGICCLGMVVLGKCVMERRLLVAIIIALFVSVGVTTRLKMSGHVFMLGATLMMIDFERGFILVMCWSAIPALTWSRVRLKAHTLNECFIGLAAGMATGYAAVWIAGRI
jgi:hypothetical protein